MGSRFAQTYIFHPMLALSPYIDTLIGRDLGDTRTHPQVMKHQHVLIGCVREWLASVSSYRKMRRTWTGSN